MFRIRLDIVSDLNSDNLLDACGVTNDDECVIVRHELPHGNPHYHAYLKNDIKENTLRQRFKRKLPNLKSTDYSIKRCDPDRVDEYIQYMFNQKKGNKWELMHSQNYDDVKLKDLQAAAKLISDEYSSQLKTTKGKGPTMWDLATEIHTLVHPTLLTINDLGTATLEEYYGNQEVNVRNYIDASITVCRKHHKGFDEFMIKKLITTAMSHSKNGRELIRNRVLQFYLKD